MPDTYFSTDKAAEVLTHETLFDAVLDHADAWKPEINPGDTVTIYEYRRKILPPLEAMLRFWSPLEGLLDAIDDDEYGCPEDPTVATEAMVKAERAFMEVVRAEYVPWCCELVDEQEVDLYAWCQEHRPDWVK